MYLYVGQFLSKQRTAAALAGLFGTLISEGTVATMTARAAGDLHGFLDQRSVRVGRRRSTVDGRRRRVAETAPASTWCWATQAADALTAIQHLATAAREHGHLDQANLFLHFAFDTWLARQFPAVTFERYVGDAVIHCVSEAEARAVPAALGERMQEVGLELHRDKTRIVYCKDGRRRGSHEHTSFTFLGFTFRARPVRPRSGRCSPASTRRSARTP